MHWVPVAKPIKEKEALDRCAATGIIKKVEEPTSWCSMRSLNKHQKGHESALTPVNRDILREVYQMPTLSEQLHKLCNTKCFLLLDVRERFLHVPFDEESLLMTTMHTSYGRYQWLCLPLDISSVPPRNFERFLMPALAGIDGVLCIADDILVIREGTTYQEAETDHDRHLVSLMVHCLEKT